MLLLNVYIVGAGVWHTLQSIRGQLDCQVIGAVQVTIQYQVFQLQEVQISA